MNAPQFYVKGHCKKENVPKMTQKLQYPKKWPNSIFEVQFCFLWWLYGSFRVCFVLNMVLEFWVWHWICYLKYPQNVCISQFFEKSGIDYTLCYGHHTLRTQRFEEHTINVPQFTDHHFTECPVFGPPLSGMHNLRTPTLRCNWLGNFIL